MTITTSAAPFVDVPAQPLTVRESVVLLKRYATAYADRAVTAALAAGITPGCARLARPAYEQHARHIITSTWDARRHADDDLPVLTFVPASTGVTVAHP
jgi:hypothetical protein